MDRNSQYDEASGTEVNSAGCDRVLLNVLFVFTCLSMIITMKYTHIYAEHLVKSILMTYSNLFSLRATVHPDRFHIFVAFRLIWDSQL